MAPNNMVGPSCNAHLYFYSKTQNIICNGHVHDKGTQKDGLTKKW